MFEDWPQYNHNKSHKQSINNLFDQLTDWSLIRFPYMKYSNFNPDPKLCWPPLADCIPCVPRSSLSLSSMYPLRPKVSKWPPLPPSCWVCWWGLAFKGLALLVIWEFCDNDDPFFSLEYWLDWDAWKLFEDPFDGVCLWKNGCTCCCGLDVFCLELLLLLWLANWYGGFFCFPFWSEGGSDGAGDAWPSNEFFWSTSMGPDAVKDNGND